MVKRSPKSQASVPELCHGAGGITYHDGRFIIVGGLPKDVNENYLYEYDEAFKFRTRHMLASGYTLMGIQTVASADGRVGSAVTASPPNCCALTVVSDSRASGPSMRHTASLLWARGGF